jgi:NTP pyrophosphatase (non-canonical NTP hydrolase)
MNLLKLQNEVKEWADSNFEKHGNTLSLLGAMEELGELAHAHLKGIQGIRHTPEEIIELKRDAVADIIVYLADYCATENIDLEKTLQDTWSKVSKRNWKNNKNDGT